MERELNSLLVLCSELGYARARVAAIAGRSQTTSHSTTPFTFKSDSVHLSQLPWFPQHREEDTKLESSKYLSIIVLPHLTSLVDTHLCILWYLGKA